MRGDAEPTEEQKDAAALWLGKRAGGSLTPAEAEDLEKWLNADRGNRLAFDQLRVLWAQLEAPAMRAAAAAPVIARNRSGASRRRAPVFAALGLSLFICLGIWVARPTLVQDWQADFVSGQQAVTDVTLPDGSIARLGADTALDIDFSENRRNVQILRGEAFFEIRHGLPTPFLVDSLGNQVRVVGTRFNVDQVRDQTTVSVEEGAVQVTGEVKAEGLLLSPGQQVIVTAGRVGAVETADIDMALSWMKGRLSVRNVLVRDLVAALQRHSQGRIFVRGSLANRRISGTFPTTDVPASLETIAAAAGGSVVRTGRWLSVLY
ncbi:FecR family protein [Shinella sp.]|uniref:FecR family protein n=1 Tax=Shinella sp. TaxID=1870904 RepID=UPI003F703A9B